MTELLFTEQGEFAACNAAEKWCAGNGVSVGAMQGRSPRGLLYGDFIIEKWRNLRPRERELLDGQMNGDMRNGPVKIVIQDRPR